MSGRILRVLTTVGLIGSSVAPLASRAQDEPNAPRPERRQRVEGRRAAQDRPRGGQQQAAGRLGATKQALERLRQEDPQEFQRLMVLRQQDRAAFLRELTEIAGPQAVGDAGGVVPPMMRGGELGPGLPGDMQGFPGMAAGAPAVRRREAMDPMEAKCRELSRLYHQEQDAARKEALKQELAAAVEEAFQRKQDAARERLEEMMRNIEEIRNAIEQRENNRGTICELRTEELTRDPRLDWDTGL